MWIKVEILLKLNQLFKHFDNIDIIASNATDDLQHEIECMKELAKDIEVARTKFIENITKGK